MRSWTVFLAASAVALAEVRCTTPPARALPDAPPAATAAAPPAAAEAAPQVATPAAAQVADARALLAAFAGMTGMEARFEEEKHLALLSAPLKCKGRIYFMPPGYLTRMVESPEPSTVRISPNELKLSGPDGEERIDLRQNDSVRVFVTSLVHVFSGDEAALERSYTAAFEYGANDGETWTLTLTPRAEPLTGMLQSLRLDGRGFLVGSIEVREPNGDRTVTRILQADVERRFSAQEQMTLFGVAPP
jgi:nucleoid-associated protein YgaU